MEQEKIPKHFVDTVKCLEKNGLKLVEVLNLEEKLAKYCTRYIKQKDVEISVIYQPADGHCLLFDCDLGRDVNVPISDFLAAVKENNYKPLDINDIYFSSIAMEED